MTALASAAVLLLGPSLASCAFLDRRIWTENLPHDQIGNWSYRSEPLRPSLEACVASHDPAHLFELRDGGDYDASEELENVREIRAVKACMAAKGWLSIPAINLGP